MVRGEPSISEADLPDAAEFRRFHPFIRGVSSQWHRTPFTIEGYSVNTAEQWMMLAKADLFGDALRRSAILATDDPAEQKRLGQQVAGFDQVTWDRWKVDVVFRGNLAKFSQNGGAGRQLKATADAMLVEANPLDWIWGVGLSMDNPKVHEPTAWLGSNLLGRVLTQVRAELA